MRPAMVGTMSPRVPFVLAVCLYVGGRRGNLMRVGTTAEGGGRFILGWRSQCFDSFWRTC